MLLPSQNQFAVSHRGSGTSLARHITPHAGVATQTVPVPQADRGNA